MKVFRGGLDEPTTDSPSLSRVQARHNLNTRPLLFPNRLPPHRYLVRGGGNRRQLLLNRSPLMRLLLVSSLFPLHGKSGRRSRSPSQALLLQQFLLHNPSPTLPKVYLPRIMIGLLGRLAVVPVHPQPVYLLLPACRIDLGRSSFEFWNLRIHLISFSKGHQSPSRPLPSVSTVR